jgi:hypothetical protein
MSPERPIVPSRDCSICDARQLGLDGPEAPAAVKVPAGDGPKTDMTKRLAFTESTIKRAVAAARKAGLAVAAVRIEPNGAVTIFQTGIEPPSPSTDDPAKSKWLDVET